MRLSRSIPRREAASAGNRPRPPHSGCERGLFRRTCPFLPCPPAEQGRVASRPSPRPRPRPSGCFVLSDHPYSRPPGNDVFNGLFTNSYAAIYLDQVAAIESRDPPVALLEAAAGLAERASAAYAHTAAVPSTTNTMTERM